MRTVTLAEPDMLDAVVWREVQPSPADQRWLFAEALRLNPHVVGLPAILPTGTVVTLPERPQVRPSAPVDMLRIFG